MRIVDDALEILASTDGSPAADIVETTVNAVRRRLEPEPDGTKPNLFTDQILMMAASSMRASVTTEAGCAWIYNTSQTRWGYVDRILGTKIDEFEGYWWGREQQAQRTTIEALNAGAGLRAVQAVEHPAEELRQAIRRIAEIKGW